MDSMEAIEHKHIPAALVAYTRFHLLARSEVPGVLQEIAAALPAGLITGPAYLHIQGFSSYTEGFSAEAGFPVSREFVGGRIRSRTMPAMEVLALTHTGPRAALRETKIGLLNYARARALISDEFSREVYPAWQDPESPVEIHFVIHNWSRLLAENLERTLGAPGRASVLQGDESLPVDASPETRFEWARLALTRLESNASEHQKYDAVSSCAHVFPAELLDKLRGVYLHARNGVGDPLAAVDAVLAFMETDPGWNETEHARVGRVIHQTKRPADPEAYAAAQSDAERRAAYCFCPVIRARLEQGMPVSYCYCGAGWFRQQWETATGKPVTVEVVRSVLKGDPVCEFATHLAEDL